MENFPISLRFRPTKKEKIAYLLYKMNGKPLPCCYSTFISTIDIFGEDEPSEIFKGPPDHEYHFFTRLRNARQQCKKGVGKGVWKGYEKVTIFDSRTEHIGLLKKYKYFNSRNANENGRWILEEYTLADKFGCCVKDEYAGYAFCTVKKVSKGDDHGVVSGREIGSLEGFFDEMLRENNSVISRYPERLGIDEDMMMMSPKPR